MLLITVDCDDVLAAGTVEQVEQIADAICAARPDIFRWMSPTMIAATIRLWRGRNTNHVIRCDTTFQPKASRNP